MPFYFRANPMGHHRGVFGTGFGQNHDELVAAISNDTIGVPD